MSRHDRHRRAVHILEDPEARYALIFVAVLGVAALIFLRTVPAGGFDKGVALSVFALLLLPYLLYSAPTFLRWLQDLPPQSRFLCPTALFLVYLLYVAGPGEWNSAHSLWILIYLGLPVILASRAVLRKGLPNLLDAVTLLLIYLPVELVLLTPAWEPSAPETPTPAHPLSQLLGINLALFCFLAIRALPEVGFTFRLRLRDWAAGLVAFGAFFPLALLLGHATAFVPFEPHLPDPARIAEVVLSVSFLVALPEEIFFRGILQNFFERLAPRTGGRWMALASASVLFGLSHLNNHPLFDWRYVTLATLAGLAYGAVYMRTRKVTAAAIPHALVDIVWRLCF